MPEVGVTWWTLELLEQCAAREVEAAASATCAPSRSAHQALAAEFRMRADRLRVEAANGDATSIEGTPHT